MDDECYRYSMTDTRAVMQPLSWVFQKVPGEKPSWDLFARGEIRESVKHADSRARVGGSQQSSLFQYSPRPYTWLCIVTQHDFEDRGYLVYKANKPYMREVLGLLLFELL